MFCFFFFTPVTGPTRSWSLKLSDTRVYEPQIRARLGSTAHFCRVADLDEVEGLDVVDVLHFFFIVTLTPRVE